MTPPVNPFHATIDPALVARAARGEPAALAGLYTHYKRASYTLALRMLGDPAAAEDVVHDVFARLIVALRRFRGEAPFGAWLRRLVANAAIDELRRRRWLSLEEPPTLAELPAAGALPEHQAEAWQLLRRLPPRARAVLVLHELEGYTHRELAELFGQSESYSKSILARALHRLSAAVADAESGSADERRYPAAPGA
ncbi:MAG: sigma-70 family RNA polymerase sigma factor [Xanthomonadales bacterium]|nr:sigma-70 family RNA polymerase sigma factor [Xanthomonadales bacterium]MBP6690892.1 sigma-70 family RNA polymerase sigma factor [Xanthomonadales bacterium]MBP7418402.1 sigma-70 family RNA polymerase sigma factor [Xanthomonadales bacterium]MBP8176128.1 sigma-70 family RNA polymerase sigma factor [Xanthomonadales bacterium]HRA37607.1 sigma-70 family RNA polymerase sigma factor [Pseudomonadota bacterium]